jgi:hypothetical protein
LSMDYYNGVGFEDDYDWSDPYATDLDNTPLTPAEFKSLLAIMKDVWQQTMQAEVNRRNLFAAIFDDGGGFHGNYYTDYKGV